VEYRIHKLLPAANYLLFGSILILGLIENSTFGARANSSGLSVPLTNSPTTQAVLTAPQASQARTIAQFETELITITRHGFEPREINRTDGRFLLMFDNRIDVPAMVLQLKRSDGEVIKEARLKREESNWYEVVSLPPGQYLLSEANHPRWSCAITIAQ